MVIRTLLFLYVRAVTRRLSIGRALAMRIAAVASAVWQAFRRATGDDAYERYLAHHRLHHGGSGAPLGRSEYFRAQQRRKWEGVRRCC
jgi:uncharacterized short protein YbdD (DUF466 family)